MAFLACMAGAGTAAFLAAFIAFMAFELKTYATNTWGQMILPVVAVRLVERGIFFVGHILGLAHPQWLVLVELFPLVRHLLDLLGFLLLLLLDLLNLWLVAILVLLFFSSSSSSESVTSFSLDSST